jgi:hypothetical protein
VISLFLAGLNAFSSSSLIIREFLGFAVSTLRFRFAAEPAGRPAPCLFPPDEDDEFPLLPVLWRFVFAPEFVFDFALLCAAIHTLLSQRRPINLKTCPKNRKNADIQGFPEVDGAGILISVY